MSWHRILGVIVLAALFGLLLRPGATGGTAEAVGVPAPMLATPAAAGVPVVVKSGGAALHDRPNAAVVRRLETGAIVQALGRTPTGDWIFVEVEAGVQGWLVSSALVSVNPAALPVYGRPQAEQFARPGGGNPAAQPAPPTASPVQETSPISEPTATPTPTATATETTPPTPTPTVPVLPPTATPLPAATPTATALPPLAIPVAPAQQPAAVSQSEAVQSSAFSRPFSPFLRIVGVVRSGGASLTDALSGLAIAALPAGEIVTLLLRSGDSGWLQAARTDGSTGWVDRAELLTAGLAKVPRMGEVKEASLPAVALPADETAMAEMPPVADGAPVLATVHTDGRRLNVRSGPGADFAVVAKADNGSSYPALSLDPGQKWMQIEIDDAPDGLGWVSALFVGLNRALPE